jgi:hypothetical protein
MTAFVRRCLEDSEFATEMGRRARQLVLEQQGAADRTCQLIAQLADVGKPPGDLWKVDVA